MKMRFLMPAKFDWLYNSLCFCKKHFKVLLSLGLVAGLGRMGQLGAFGEVSRLTFITLEIMIEVSRILLFVYVLGLASLKTGASRIKQFFTHKHARKHNVSAALKNLKSQWMPMLLNLVVFAVIAWAVNYLIDALAYETCLYITLRRDGVIAESASEWAIILFFKNLSVIPFTLIFYAMFLLWITNTRRNFATGKP